MKIPFNKPTFTGKELEYITDAVNYGHISGDGIYTKKCHKLLEEYLSAKKVLLTTSCTHALELASILLDIKEGDEVIVPSFTFVSTVNAFMLRGAKPVFVDIRPDTKNIDENLIEEKITEKTKAIFPVHYAGVSCEMDKINSLAEKHNLSVIEDAAQALGGKYKNKHLGILSDIGCFSFHETKNVVCGEGGAIVINNEKFIERAEIIREKGTNRSKFLRGQVDKYTWVDVGSSFLPSDVLAAFLYAQLEKIEEINSRRKKIYEKYFAELKPLESEGRLELPVISENCLSSYHMFYILLESEVERNSLIDYLKLKNITSVFHYIPLHSSPMGLKLGNNPEDLPITENISKRLLRLPFYNSISLEEQEFVVNSVKKYMYSKFAAKIS